MEKHIKKSQFTDGSIAYDLLIIDENSDTMVQLHCVDKDAAMRLYDALELDTIDFVIATVC